MYQPRSSLHSTAALSALVGIVLALIFAPALERDAHVMTLRTGDRDEVLEALRRLCWIESGREELNLVLPELALRRRVVALEAAGELGCLTQLAPLLQATYLVWRPGEEGSAEALVGLGASALMPAVEALESSRPEVQMQAMNVLGTLEGHMAPSTRERVVEILESQPRGLARDTLLREMARELGAAGPPTAPEWGAEEVVDDAVAIAGVAAQAAAGADVDEQGAGEEGAGEEGAGEELDEPAEPSRSLQLRPPSLQAPQGLAPGGFLYVRPVEEPAEEPAEEQGEGKDGEQGAGVEPDPAAGAEPVEPVGPTEGDDG